MVTIYEWLFAALFWVGALMFLTGLALLIAPATVLRLSAPMNRWIITDAVFHRLDRPIRLERVFYRYHVVMGLLIIGGAGYCLYSLPGWPRLPDAVLGAHPEMNEVVFGGMTYALGFGNLLALVIGLIVLVRPSLLKGIEVWSNIWVASDSLAEKLNRRMDITDRWLPRFPRLLGLLTVIGSLYIMSNTVMVALK